MIPFLVKQTFVCPRLSAGFAAAGTNGRFRNDVPTLQRSLSARTRHRLIWSCGGNAQVADARGDRSKVGKVRDPVVAKASASVH